MKELAQARPRFGSLRIAATGATLLFLAPYSPDLNPIEHDFAALKKRREYQDHPTREDIVRGYH